MYHGNLALLLFIIARVHMDDLLMYLTLFPIHSFIEVRCVFISINIDAVFLLRILRSFGIEIFLRPLHRTFFDAVEGWIVSVKCLTISGFIVARCVKTSHLLVHGCFLDNKLAAIAYGTFNHHARLFVQFHFIHLHWLHDMASLEQEVLTRPDCVEFLSHIIAYCHLQIG